MSNIAVSSSALTVSRSASPSVLAPLTLTRPATSAGSFVTDYLPFYLTKTVSGYVYDSGGATVSGATVLLFRQIDNFYCNQTTSDGSGYYSFQRDNSDTNDYYIIAFTTTLIHGISDRGNVPS